MIYIKKNATSIPQSFVLISHIMGLTFVLIDNTTTFAKLHNYPSIVRMINKLFLQKYITLKFPILLANNITRKHIKFLFKVS